VSDIITEKQAETGLEVAFRILDKWGFDVYERSKIIGSGDDRIMNASYILNIHSALRMLFSNPDNIYGWPSMKNNNGKFDGRTPKDLMLDGDIEYVCQHLVGQLH